MIRNVVNLLIRVFALSALVSAFMSLFLRMNIPGMTSICLGLMFLCYAFQSYWGYQATGQKLNFIGVALCVVAFFALVAQGILDIVQ